MTEGAAAAGDRLAKIIARSGLCSRRDAEGWIKDGRVAVNGKVIRTPAFNVTERDKIAVDGAPLAAREGTRVWLYHKPAGLVVTEKDPEGRPTIFDKLATEGLPRVVTIGRLDINTEGLLLLTNDGGLKRVLELPATGWLRRYRVRAHGTVTQGALDGLKDGTEIEGVKYGPIEATLERQQGANVWLLLALREGKNREVKNVLGALGLEVNRLIRVSYGPFQLGEIPVGGVEAVKARVLRDQLGKRLAEQAGADFESEQPVRGKPVRERDTGRGTNTVEIARERFRFADRPDGERAAHAEQPPPRRDRPGRPELARRPPRPAREAPASEARPRKIHYDDGRESAVFAAKTYGKPPARGDKAGAAGAERPKRDFGDKPKRTFADKPRRDDKAAGKPYDKPKRSFGEKPPRTFADKPKRSFADKPKGDFTARPRPARPAAAGAPPGSRPPRAAAGEGAARKPYVKRSSPAAPGAVGRGNRKDGVARGPRKTGPAKPGPARGARPDRPPRTRT